MHQIGHYLMVNVVIGVDGTLTVAAGDEIANRAEQRLYGNLEYLRQVSVHYHPALGKRNGLPRPTGNQRPEWRARMPSAAKSSDDNEQCVSQDHGVPYARQPSATCPDPTARNTRPSWIVANPRPVGLCPAGFGSGTWPAGAGRHPRPDAAVRRPGTDRRRRDGGRPPRSDPQLRGGRPAQPRGAAADVQRYVVPHRLDDQADHRHRRHDPGGGGQVVAGRSGGKTLAGVSRPDACGDDQWFGDAQAAGAEDHHSRLAYPHLGAAKRSAAGPGRRLCEARSHAGRSDSHNRQAPLEFEPGSRWAYCNAGIDTLGRIIEVASGEPYERFLQQRIFTPLGMADTTFYPSPQERSRIASLYDSRGGKLVPAGYQLLGPTENARYPSPPAASTRPAATWLGSTG